MTCSFRLRWCLTVEGFLQTAEMQKTVRGVSPRLLATGLLSSSANSAGVRITGVIPQDEPAVSLIPERMVEGTYLSSDMTSLPASSSAPSWLTSSR